MKSRRIKSKDYHDYVIKNGKFVGAFEEMYQNIEDPWYHGDAAAVQYDMALYLLNRYKICVKGGEILDLGCGKGAFTSRLKRKLPLTHVLAVDIAPTATRKAREKYGHLGIDFKVMDIQKSLRSIRKKFDLIVMSQLMWYILPNFKKVVNHLAGKNLKRGGYLLVNQTFYRPEEQKYGKEFVSSIQDMLRLIRMNVVEIIELNRLSNHNAIILFKKGG